jgi:hypothetical protein
VTKKEYIDLKKQLEKDNLSGELKRLAEKAANNYEKEQRKTRYKARKERYWDYQAIKTEEKIIGSIIVLFLAIIFGIYQLFIDSSFNFLGFIFAIIIAMIPGVRKFIK